MNNRMILITIVVLLVGIAAMMAFNYQKRHESIGDKVGEAIEEVGDEIDDAN